jgi:hypothetical protein
MHSTANRTDRGGHPSLEPGRRLRTCRSHAGLAWILTVLCLARSGPLNGQVPSVMSEARTVGIFRPPCAGGLACWVVDSNGDHQWQSQDATFWFGLNGDIPVMVPVTYGGQTHLRLAIFRNGAWYVDVNGNGLWDGTPTDAIYYFGLAGDYPIVGNWSPSDRSTLRIGVYRPGTNGNGALWLDQSNPPCNCYNAYTTGVYPLTGLKTPDMGTQDIPVLVIDPYHGDPGQGNVPNVAFFRPATGEWFLNPYDPYQTYSFNLGVRTWSFGLANDRPAVGDWSGEGTGPLNIGVFRNQGGPGAWSWIPTEITFRMRVISEPPRLPGFTG